MSDRPAGEVPDWEVLVAAVLDDELPEPDRARFEALLAGDPVRARAFAREVLLHDAIERELVAGSVGRRSARIASSRRAIPRLATAAALLLGVGLVALFLVRGTPASASAGELDRIAASAAASVMRTYSVRAVDVDPRPRGGDARRQDGGSREARSKPSIDDAVLHVGSRDCYVLERTADDGTRVVSGSDGSSAWSVPARGPVRSSANPARFRGALPGQRHGLPFVNPVDGLDELRRSYDVTREQDVEFGGRAARRLSAVRRADVSGGPKRVEICYDGASGTILRMTLDRLPQAGGGPRAVVLELVAERPVDPAFFSAAAHHAPGRAFTTDDQP